MDFISLFAGIGGFDLGFERAGMRCVAQVEWDTAAQSVLKHHYPHVQRFGDVKDVGRHNLPAVDLICGGFPCQDVSVAGKRAGLAGERSRYWFEFHRVLTELKPRIAVIENVPGLLSSNGGRDFAAILRGLEECGYLIAWRILDAQYAGVPQRRRRLFIVGSLGDGRCAEILFERESVSWSAEQVKRTRGAAAIRFSDGAGNGRIAGTLGAEFGRNRDLGNANETDFLVSAYAMQRSDQYRSASVASTLAERDYKSATTIVTYGLSTNLTPKYARELSPTITAQSPSGGGQPMAVAGAFGVRRLTPVEHERLQGFPDGWTAGQSDGKRYRQLGNAVAVPVAEWIGRRIVMFAA